MGELKEDGKPTKMVVYGRNGANIIPHQYKRCNFRNKIRICREGHSYGFVTYKGMRIYDNDCLKNDILLVSKQTAFTIEYLIELVSLVNLSSETFEAASKRFNRFHFMKLPTDVMDKRVELSPDTVNKAYFLYAT